MAGITPRPHFAEQDFRKASASVPDRECVRVARNGGWVELRDDKVIFGSQDDVHIVLTDAEFDAFQEAIRAGRPTAGLALRLDEVGRGRHVLRAAADQASTTLTFTAREIAVFLDGVRKHEFDQDRYQPAA